MARWGYSGRGSQRGLGGRFLCVEIDWAFCFVCLFLLPGVSEMRCVLSVEEVFLSQVFFFFPTRTGRILDLTT